MTDILWTPIETTGSLDLIRTDSDVLRIEGWAAAYDGRPIDGFKVHLGGQAIATLDVQAGLPSPDVAAARPDLPLGGSCRFLLSSRAPTEIRNVLVWATPMCGRLPGRSLYRLIDPLLPLPPEKHIQAIGGEFQGVAFEMLGHFIERGRLRPEDRVLDVGCGVGRIAYALAYYLNARAQYDGFDVMRPLVDWASDNLGDRLPNFRFRHVDVYNRLYNPHGTLRGKTFAFPYPDASFDFVCLTSVFTHMRGPEVRHYLDEIARVLAGGGRVVVTAFLLTPQAKDLIQRGLGTQTLVHRCGGGYVADPRVPEGAVGYDEDVLVRWIEESGLRVTGLSPGSWCGRSPALSYQDLMVLEPAVTRRSPSGTTRSHALTRWLVQKWRA